MKIKTKTMSYEEVMALPSWEHKKPKKPSKLLAGVARMLLGGELKKVNFTCEKVDMEKAGDGPWLVLMNHCSFTDLSIVQIYFCVQFVDILKVVIGLLMLRSDFWARNVVNDDPVPD